MVAAAQIAPVGEKGKVVVKWKTTPTKCEGVDRWRAQLVPSREEYSAEDADVTLQLRAEAYNVFNVPLLTAQGDNWRTLASSSFGLYNAAGATRRMQFAVRLTW